jgi:quinoprotein glucose dehydrogenase
MSRTSRVVRQLAGVVLLAAPVVVIDGADSKKAGEWAFYSSDNRASKYSPLDQINKDNVSRLRVAWRRPQADPALIAANPDIRLSNRYTATPIVANGVMYIPDGFGLVEALDPESGRTLWVQKPLAPAPDALQGGGAHWGVAYWSQGSEGRIFSTRAQYLFALDAKSGVAISDFGDNGKVDLNVGLGPLMKSFRWSGVPLIVRDVVVVGSSMLEQDSARTKEGPPGDVRAYDVRTGKLRWQFHVIPHPGEPGGPFLGNCHQDVAIRHRRRSDQSAHCAGRWRQEVQGARQEQRTNAVGDRARGWSERRADDV